MFKIYDDRASAQYKLVTGFISFTKDPRMRILMRLLVIGTSRSSHSMKTIAELDYDR